MTIEDLIDELQQLKKAHGKLPNLEEVPRNLHTFSTLTITNNTRGTTHGYKKN